MIRPATESDVSAILALIRELADYEKLSADCVATEEGLRRNLFGPAPAAQATVAEREGRVVGYAIWFRTFSTFLAKPGIYLEDLYVQPAFRGKGIGKSFLKYLARIAVENDYGRIEWSVLKWNAPSIAFYKSLGAVPLAEWDFMRLTGEALQTFAESQSP